MTTRKDGTVHRQLKTLFNLGTIRELTDGQLLERFATGRGEVAELAFAALVERHGAMVLRVCRAQLVNTHDTQDAFQATFLILVKKARGLWVRDSLGPWLHQVAFRTASCARATEARRRKLERRAAEATGVVGLENETGSDLGRLLHEEINRLPERYRVPIVLCDLEGHTCEEAARQMGRPVGTVRSWRTRGRERLRDRLTRSGLAPSAVLEATLAADVARASVPKPEAEKAVRMAFRALSNQTTAGEVSASVAMLVKGVLKTMLFRKLRTTAATFLTASLLAVGLGTVARVGAEDSKKAVDEARTEPPRPTLVKQARGQSSPFTKSGETWPLTLREAIRIGLDNSEVVRVVSLGGTPKAVGGYEPPVADALRAVPLRGDEPSYKIAPLTDEIDPQRFKAEVMAGVRSIEQQYWSLAQQHVQLSSSEKAVELAEEILKREKSDLEVGRGTAVDVAEAQQRLEQFRLDLGTKTSDVITVEQGLRHLLGLPVADNRKIIPVSFPTAAKLEPDWEQCKAAMLENQPDIVEAKARVKAAEADTSGRRSLELKKAQARLDQIVRQTTHSLARFFLEIEANYQQFKSASRFRTAAAQRLEAQRAFHEEGQITIDRYLDAVSQYASAVAQEGQFKTSYNISIVALEEAKGTLLEYDKITVVKGPQSSEATKHDVELKAASHKAQTPAPHATAGPVAVETKDASPEPDPAGKTYSFQMTLGSGPKPFEIRGSFSITPSRSADSLKVP